MSLLRRKRSYDRRDLLERAAKAGRSRRRGRRRRAIELYRRVLAREPDDPDVLRKLAALLARTDGAADACTSYRRAAEAFVARGFVDRAVGVYREAVQSLPRESSLWKELAKLELARERRTDAVTVLLEGRRAFARRRDRQQAGELLWTARRLAPTHLELNLDLASLLGQTGATQRGVALLEELLSAHAEHAVRIRARQLRLAPGPRAAWRWLAALMGQSPRPARS